jgi:hypothetical protein
MLRALLFCAACAVACAQADEIAAVCDGAADETLKAEGAATAVTTAGRFKIGKAAYRVAPAEGQRFYGPEVSDVATKGAPELVCVLFLEGDRPRDFRFRLRDAQSGNAQKDGLVEYRTLNPGWNDVVVSLKERTTGDGRKLDFATKVAHLQISKRADAGDPAVLLDGVLRRFASAPAGGADAGASRPATAPGPVEGGAPAPTEPTAEQRAAAKKFAAAVAAEKDGQKRGRVVREGIDALGDELRVDAALKLLREDDAPRVRRAAREALARTAGEPAVKRFLAGLKGLEGQARIEALHALAGAPADGAKAAAKEIALLPKTGVGERTAIVSGFAKRGRADVAALAAACPPAGPWPPRAAFVRALRVGATKESVDGLIDVLKEPGSERVADDCEEALVALTGQNLGRNAEAWRAWWAVQREKTKVADSGRRAAAGYATFYGVTVPKGRVAFVVDTSGSMREKAEGGKLDEYRAQAKHLQGAKIETRLDLAKAELAHAVATIKDGAFVGAVAFGTERLWLSDGLEKVETVFRERLQRRLASLGFSGTTNVHAGLFSAFHPGKEPTERDWAEGPDTLFLLSDGNPSSGKYADREELRDEVLAWNLGRAIKIHCVNVGDADVQMLRAWTQSSGGTLLDLRSDRPAPKPAK